MNSLRKTILLLTFFSIAMGFLESAVVVYLRELYYPGGFRFPLVPIAPQIAIVEFLREAATLVMLITIGMLAGKTKAQRFCFFLFCFAVWDIFYYVFLKLFISWPASLFTWDILFLIPVPWTGPVLAPCLASLTMIVLMVLIVYFEEKSEAARIARSEWILMISGAVVMIASFIQDYVSYILHNQSSAWMPGAGQKLFDDFLNYVPETFNWKLFALGEFLLTGAIVMIWKRLSRTPLERAVETG